MGGGEGFGESMANVQTIYEGGELCAPGYVGQRFTIWGDPDGRTYTCADMGDGVADEHWDIFFRNSDSGWAWWVQMGSNIVTIEIVH
jgi:hypothetical protein